MSDRYLLHSLTLYEREILAALELARPRRVIEIGSETGGFTLKLASWASAHEALVVSVDTDPAPAVLEASRESAHLDVIRGASPWALEGLEPADAYVIDGDHNYWTVRAELDHALADDRRPLIVLHDVGWPCGRRDQYYSPERIPSQDIHAYSYDGGVRPGERGLVPHGFSGAGHFAYALVEGGERNGVLTAVEDALRARPDLDLVVVPAVFGLGLVFPSAASWAPALRSLIEPLSRSSLLAAMEANRVVLYLRVLELQDALAAERVDAERTIRELRERLGLLEDQHAGTTAGSGPHRPRRDRLRRGAKAVYERLRQRIS